MATSVDIGRELLAVGTFGIQDDRGFSVVAAESKYPKALPLSWRSKSGKSPRTSSIDPHINRGALDSALIEWSASQTSPRAS